MSARGLMSEAAKLPAFVRRDFLTALSYRTAFLLDWTNLFVQTLIFALIGELIDPAAVSASGGQGSYLEFAAVGVAVAAFMQLALTRATSAVRNEQLMGTLESVLLAPISPLTFALGSVMYDLAYVPVRTVIFLLGAAWLFELGFAVSGLLPVLVMLLAFIPFVWGLGMAGAATTLTVRRGAPVAAAAGLALTLGSTAYFPLEVLPPWAQVVAEINPLTVTLESARASMLGGEGWAPVPGAIGAVVPFAVVTMVTGVIALRLAIMRERRKGSLGMY